MIFERVKELIATQLNIEKDKIQRDSNFIRDLRADSLDVVDLIITFEEEFDLLIDDEAVETIKTVGDVVDYLEKKK